MNYFYSELQKHGITFDYAMICPHALEDECECKKPKIGGLKDFLHERADIIDLNNSLMFGDRETDRQFAESLGVIFVPIQTNKKFKVPS